MFDVFLIGLDCEDYKRRKFQLMKITEEWLESVGFERNMYSNHAKPVGVYDTYLCIDDNGLYVSLIDDEEGYSVNLRPLNTQEEVRELYKVLSQEEL